MTGEPIHITSTEKNGARVNISYECTSQLLITDLKVKALHFIFSTLHTDDTNEEE